MAKQRLRIQGNILPEKITQRNIIGAQKIIQFNGKIAAHIGKRTPLPPGFPPPVVSGIGSKNNEQWNGKTEQVMHEGNIFQPAFIGKFEVFQLYISNTPTDQRRNE